MVASYQHGYPNLWKVLWNLKLKEIHLSFFYFLVRIQIKTGNKGSKNIISYNLTYKIKET